MVPEESSRLLEQARRGSREAINAILERYGERLHALIRLRLGPQLRRWLESRDILQATLLEAFKGLVRFEGSASRSPLKADAERLEQALDTLGETHREVVLLRYYDELSFSEIGARLGMSPDAFRRQLARAMTALTLELRKLP